MSVRTRIFLVSLVVALVPFALVAFGLKRETAAHVSELDRANLATLTETIEREVARSAETLRTRLAAIQALALDDNELRLALLEPAHNAFLADYAARIMPLTGLTLLQLQDGSGRILSSGHFRNDYGRIDARLLDLLRQRPGPVLLEFRTASDTRLALATEIELEIAGVRYVLIGGISPDEISWLQGSDPVGHLEVYLRTPGSELPEPEGARVEAIELPFVTGGDVQESSIEIWRVRDPASEALRGIDRWFIGFLLLAWLGAGALGLAASTWVSGPLRELAEKTTRVNLRRYRVRFESDRKDEVGELTRFVGGMVERLRESAAELQDAERRATLGELARQINHDVKNGVTPIRNVLRHLVELEQSDPQSIGRVFQERRHTLESSLAYLEALAANFARLTPRLDRRPVDVNETLRLVADALLAPAGVELRLRLAPDLPAVSADPLGLRRILENVARNAVEAVTPEGVVTISSARLPVAESPFEGSEAVRISVSDTGPGLSVEERSRIFEHFYTTKPAGTGLGLSIVKRLVADFGGTLTIESEPGRGSTFRVTLPAAHEVVRAPEMR